MMAISPVLFWFIIYGLPALPGAEQGQELALRSTELDPKTKNKLKQIVFETFKRGQLEPQRGLGVFSMGGGHDLPKRLELSPCYYTHSPQVSLEPILKHGPGINSEAPPGIANVQAVPLLPMLQ